LAISINAVVFLLIIVLGDVPAGVLADKWQRRYVLLIAFAALFISSLIGGFSNNLLEYLPMTIALGAFVVLTQGTFQALMYDTLRTIGESNTYDRHQGVSYALFLSGLSISSLVGGYMAQWFDFRATYFATAAFMLVACVMTLSLVESKIHKPITDRKLKEHVAFGVRHIFANKLLLQLALLITAAGVLRSAQNEYAGLLFIALGLGAIPMGYATAVKWLVSSFGQIIAPKIGRRVLKLTPLFFITFLLFSVVQSQWSLLFFYVSCFLYAIISNQAEAAVQDNTPSEIRATMLSIFSFASNIILVPLSILFGWIAQHSNVFNAYLMIAAVGILYLISWMLRGRKIIMAVTSLPARATKLPSAEDDIV